MANLSRSMTARQFYRQLQADLAIEENSILWSERFDIINRSCRVVSQLFYDLFAPAYMTAVTGLSPFTSQGPIATRRSDLTYGWIYGPHNIVIPNLPDYFTVQIGHPFGDGSNFLAADNGKTLLFISGYNEGTGENNGTIGFYGTISTAGGTDTVQVSGNGLPPSWNITAITVNSNVMTITIPNHTLVAGNKVLVAGALGFATPALANAYFSGGNFTVIDTNTIQVTCGGAPGGSWTGGGKVYMIPQSALGTLGSIAVVLGSSLVSSIGVPTVDLSTYAIMQDGEQSRIRVQSSVTNYVEAVSPTEFQMFDPSSARNVSKIVWMRQGDSIYFAKGNNLSSLGSVTLFYPRIPNLLSLDADYVDLPDGAPIEIALIKARLLAIQRISASGDDLNPMPDASGELTMLVKAMYQNYGQSVQQEAIVEKVNALK